MALPTRGCASCRQGRCARLQGLRRGETRGAEGAAQRCPVLGNGEHRAAWARVRCQGRPLCLGWESGGPAAGPTWEGAGPPCRQPGSCGEPEALWPRNQTTSHQPAPAAWAIACQGGTTGRTHSVPSPGAQRSNRGWRPLRTSLGGAHTEAGWEGSPRCRNRGEAFIAAGGCPANGCLAYATLPGRQDACWIG